MHETIGEKIKRLRIARKLSVEQLAKMIGKGRATVYRYENGEIKEIPCTVLQPIAKALSVSLEYLITENQAEKEYNEKVKAELSNYEFSLIEKYRLLSKKQQTLVFSMIEQLFDSNS